MEVLGRKTGNRLDGIGVEAELEHVSRLRIRTGQLGVDRLVSTEAQTRLFDPDEEVGHAPHPVVEEWHLIDDVVTGVHRIAHSLHPRGERLAVTLGWYLVDVESPNPVFGQAGRFVLDALVDQQLRH